MWAMEEKEKIPDFIPKANTCTNAPQLPRPTITLPLIGKEKLFNKYDLAFKNTHFGHA